MTVRPPAADTRRTRVALLAHMRQELSTPANAILGHSELLLEDARATGGPLDDLKKIRGAGRDLLATINRVCDPARLDDGRSREALEAYSTQLRLELRTPVNTIVGYAEMLLEDAAASGQVALVPQLQKIHVAARKLIEQIDDIVRFSIGDVGFSAHEAASGVAALVRDAVAAIPPLSHGSPSHIEGATLLIADDNEINRDMLREWLEREGYRVVEARDGREALARLETAHPDLMLLDIVMPEINGFEVLQRVKADPALQDIPAIMISGLDEIDSVVRCIEAGAEDYLSKPFNPVLLNARIGACLEKKRLRDREALHLSRIEEEKRRADELLHVILPAPVVEELKIHNGFTPRRYEDVAVLFVDIVEFTPYCAKREPEEIVAHLQELIEAFEDLAVRHAMLKIKTSGDGFLATAGLINVVADPLLPAVRCALDMIAVAPRLTAGWQVRAGIHAGPVMAGIVGRRPYAFDLWGDTVNTAARLESHGFRGALNVSPSVWARISHVCRGESLGRAAVKGKGEMEIFRVDGFL